MNWYEKFKVGQEVRVVKEVPHWEFPNGGGCSWNNEINKMHKTVGKVYKIIDIDKFTGYQLDTGNELGMDYWYPVDSLDSVSVVGRQLLFEFYEGILPC